MAPILRDSNGNQRLLQGGTSDLQPAGQAPDLRDTRFQFSLRLEARRRDLTGPRRMVLTGIRWGRKPVTKG